MSLAPSQLGSGFIEKLIYFVFGGVFTTGSHGVFGGANDGESLRLRREHGV